MASCNGAQRHADVSNNVQHVAVALYVADSCLVVRCFATLLAVGCGWFVFSFAVLVAVGGCFVDFLLRSFGAHIAGNT